MATKIRLQRHGHKDYAFYPIVVADSRAPRDGRFIERIGSYNPNTNPATISLNFERALHWVNCGAIPTDTVRNILSREGVMLMKHLQGGVKKGAFDEAEAQKRFDAWKAEKDAKIEAAKANLANAKSADQKKRKQLPLLRLPLQKLQLKKLPKHLLKHNLQLLQSHKKALGNSLTLFLQSKNINILCHFQLQCDFFCVILCLKLNLISYDT